MRPGRGVLLVAPYEQAFGPGDQVDVGGAYERAVAYVRCWLGEHGGGLDGAARESVQPFADDAWTGPVGGDLPGGGNTRAVPTSTRRQEATAHVPPSAKSESIYVYFIQACITPPEAEIRRGVGVHRGHVKIGKTAYLILRYLTFRGSTPPEVTLVPLGFVHAEDYPEDELHRRFHEFRHGGTEWFRPAPELMGFIDECADEFPELDQWGRAADAWAWGRRLAVLGDPAERKANRLTERDLMPAHGSGSAPPGDAAVAVVRQFMAEHGAHLGRGGIFGSTPLHTASSWGRLDVARYLVEQGADLEAADSEGRSPLHCACNAEVRALLRQLGAKEP